MPTKNSQSPIVRGWRRKYDWEEWFAKRQFTLNKGEHYECSISSMGQQIRNNANLRGISVSIEEENGVFTVTVTERAEP